MTASNGIYKVFVVDDDEWYSKLLEYTLKLNPDFEVFKFHNGKDLIDNLSEKPSLITLDYRLPDMDGAEILKKIKDFNPEIEVIIVSEQENIETAVELLKKGAYDYLVKTKDIKDRLLNTVHNILKNNALKTKIDYLQTEVEKKYAFQNTLIGASPSLKKVLLMMEKATETNITVMITGETGTGKEVVAKAIHYNSNRKNKPFVAVNMAAIPAELIESELFGFEKGSFTGAGAKRIGKFEEANGGTLFLDEIGEMDISFQAKLLRALQEKEITRIGNNKPVKIDTRIVVATHKNLQEEIKNGKFRQDLYFRLFGLPIELPPLRERGNDTLLLARHFIKNFCKENSIPEKTLSTNAQKKLLSYSYPGNIRELKAIVELSVVMANGKEIDADNLVFSQNDVLPNIVSEEMTLREYDLKIVNTYLSRFDNNIKLVAEKLDIGQATIYRMLKENK